MAKVSYHYFGLGMAAEGSEKFAADQTAAFLAYVERDSIRSAAEDAAPATVPLAAPELIPDVAEHDVVAIYDNAGIPSIMHRFRRITNKELFGGSDKVHPAFIIGGEVYDEIFISVYQNTMINGKPYSLPMAEPVYNITQDDFAEACFSKGEGWHCITAAEWGLLADISLKLGTLPHGNTNCGSWHGDSTEKGVLIGSGPKTLTGSGPATWTHNHKLTGVHDLCGNLWEHCRGARIKDGYLQAAKNNDAALPETDLTENGDDWRPITDDAGRPLRVSVDGDEIKITAEQQIKDDYSGCCWADVAVECESEQLKELAFFAGEPDAYCFVDSTEGEYILSRGGAWFYGADNGVFALDLYRGRTNSDAGIGGRSAYFKKHSTLNPDTLTVERQRDGKEDGE